MINIVVPMAGRGSRFSKQGYGAPKPLIPVLGRPMIQLVIENLTPKQSHRFIFICQKEHLENFSLRNVLENAAPNCIIVELEQVTQGAACTVLTAKSYIDNDDPLMIANCDQYVEENIDNYLSAAGCFDGLIMTMRASDNKWSYIDLDEHGRVCRVVEKEVISDKATVGIYNFRRGADFVHAAERMISKNLRVNNEFYVAPAYNEMISDGKLVTYFSVGELGSGMHGIGTPEDLESFIKLKAR